MRKLLDLSARTKILFQLCWRGLGSRLWQTASNWLDRSPSEFPAQRSSQCVPEWFFNAAISQQWIVYATGFSRKVRSNVVETTCIRVAWTVKTHGALRYRYLPTQWWTWLRCATRLIMEGWDSRSTHQGWSSLAWMVREIHGGTVLQCGAFLGELLGSVFVIRRYASEIRLSWEWSPFESTKLSGCLVWQVRWYLVRRPCQCLV